MNPMHEALKRHMLKAKAGAVHPADGDSHAEEAAESPTDEMNEDRAPQLAGAAGAPQIEAGVGQNPHSSGEGELNAEHASILHALMQNSSSHPGRGPMSFDEKAHGSMKEKMAAIQKNKEGKGKY
jgi:hypothetical protein